MQLSTLLPLLALLATSTPTLASTHRRHSAKAVDHARAVERLATAVERRQPVGEVAKPKRKVVRKRGTTCRAKTTTSSEAQAAATTTSQAAATAAETSSTWVEPAENYTNGTNTSQAAQDSSSATSTSAAAAATTSASSNSTSTGQYTPNGKKAGIAGGDAYDQCEDYIGWWYDWSANPSGHTGTPIAVPMLWGAGTVDSTDASRLSVFEAITTAPQYIMGFEEPDCSTWGSANIDVSTAAGLWNSLIGPFKAKGSTLISPSMCHQAAEQYIGWLASFEKQISVSWDITNIHVNKNNMDGVKTDIDYYWNTFGKPIWVTEFACVDDSTDFVPCTDQSEINTYINDIVALFEADERVHAYAYSNGDGLGDVWPMYKNGALSESGQTYVTAISNVQH